MSRTRLKLTEPIEREPLITVVLDATITIDLRTGTATSLPHLGTETAFRKKSLDSVTVAVSGSDTLDEIEERLLLASGRVGTIERNGREPTEPTGNGGGR